MKYESSILKRLIDTYGVIGNPRYLSEIIKEFIVRGKELYPQLFTYQSDWLAHIDEFGLTPEYTVSYTGQHIYAPNTKEKPVKSAILKGQTLVNVAYRKRGTYKYIDYNLLFIDKTKSYFIKFNATFVAAEIGFMVDDNTWNISKSFPATKNGYIIIKPDEAKDLNTLRVCFPGNVDKSFIPSLKLICIEYQDGMENLDIPYFDGMQSVKMPVLTTSNEDGTKTNTLSTPSDLELRGIGDVRDELNCLTGEVINNVGKFIFDGTHDYGVGTTGDVTRISISNVNARPKTQPICDKLKSILYRVNSQLGDELACIHHTNDRIDIYISTSKCGATIDEIKAYLTTNPITVQYQLETDSIKTVGLTIHDKDQQKVERLTSFEGGTHFTTSSQDGSLLPTLTVDVVTDLEETLVVCSLEGNTM